MILVNGTVSDAVSALDRGLAYGDGIFRTFPAHRGVPLHWRRQYAKLAHDCAALKLPAPSAELLAAEVKTACGAAAQAAVKITITRGVGARGYRYRGDAEPTRIVSAEMRADTADAGAGGVRVRLCS